MARNITRDILWYNVYWFLITCVSGPSEPMLVAPSLTTSVSWVMVLAEDWAAWASFSWLDAAPATSSLVSSTSVLAVFKMLSLREGTHCVTICSADALPSTSYVTQWVLGMDGFRLCSLCEVQVNVQLAHCTCEWVIRNGMQLWCFSVKT